MSDKSKIYKKNLERLKRINPSNLNKIQTVKNKTVEFCKSSNGLLNLVKKIDGETYYFHDEEDPFLEARIWFSTLNLKNTQVVFVYGLGLGYYYEAIEEWLKENDKRTLVFIEDDPEVIHCFLETEYATKVLNNSQVKIFYLETLERSLAKFDAICRNFIGLNHKISAISLYLRLRSAELMRINSLISFLSKVHQMKYDEYRKFSIPFFLNYYLNLYSLPESYLAKPLWGNFIGVPAIICGAGPSLKKNIGLLKTLKNKALLFGGSTSINALSAEGIVPHFGVGIDPNIAQLNRVVTNHAFQTPYFINFRMNAFATHAIHGDHLYVNGTSIYTISNWVDKGLGISGPHVKEGHNVINYAFSLAVALGCNPITFVGVDLAYSEGESYTKLTPEHALYKGEEKFLTKTASEDLIVRKDIHGEPIHTLWKWLMESMWYSRSALDYVTRDIYNATEGGIGFPGIPNIQLSEFADNHLKKQYDFNGMIHSKIQSLCGMPDHVNESAITKLLIELKSSTEHCAEFCRDIIEGYATLIGDIADHKEYPKNLLSPKIIKNVSALNDEVAYQYTLIIFMNHLTELLNKELEKLELDKEWLSKEELDQEMAQIHLTRFNFIKEASEKNLRVIDNALQVSEKHQIRKNEFKSVEQDTTILVKLPQDPSVEYAFIDGLLKIKDPFYHIDLEEKIHSEKKEEFHNNGQLKSVQYDLEDLPHGPSRFYSAEGVLLSECWYLYGNQIGRGKAFYHSGELYSETGFIDGASHGPQNYYYRNGKVRSQLNYTFGKLDGPLYLFFTNGQIKREIHFKNEKREGKEILWNFEGNKIGEAEYRDDISIGSARFMSPEGITRKEVSFDADGSVINTKFWDPSGALIDIPQDVGKDYFDLVSIKMKTFTENLSDITSNLEKIIPHVGEDRAVADLKKEVALIRLDIDNLLELNKKMKLHTDAVSGGKEPIWKTPTMQENITDMMEQLSKNLKVQVEKVQHEFINILNTILENGIEKK